MKKIKLFVLGFICFTHFGNAKAGGDFGRQVYADSLPDNSAVDLQKNWLQQSNIPTELKGVLDSLEGKYRVSFALNPFYLRGDFNGDGSNEIAILIEDQAERRGILIYDVASKKNYTLGAGNSFGYGDDDFHWMDIWYVYKKGPVEAGVGEDTIPKLQGEAIWVEKSESASALIYWNGKKFKWYQQGD